MTDRSMLCVGVPEPVSAAIRRGMPGWNLSFRTGFDEATAAARAGAYRVGLLFLTGLPDSAAGRAQELVTRHGDMVWIALIHDAARRMEPWMQLVAESFFDYHTLPLDVPRLAVCAGHAHGIAQLRTTMRRHAPAGVQDDFEMVGSSSAMQGLFRAIRRIAAADAPVLIAGESGTGKELAAQAIHERSRRAKGPFVAVNCAALPPGLIHSELFGHEKGSFTGAAGRRIGHIDAAAGGTIFLDEIGDVPLELQVHLLRFLQESEIQRVGGNESLSVDVRVVAATNVDLEAAVRAGRFREDLYYRLNVLRLDVPALREREGDVEILARFFFERFTRQERSRVRGFSRQALQTIHMHDWPGNVRELINRVRRAIVMCEGDLIGPADLGLERRQGERDARTLEEARDQGEREAIRNALRRNVGNVTHAARELGVSRMTLYRLLDRHRIEAPHPARMAEARTDETAPLNDVAPPRRETVRG